MSLINFKSPIQDQEGQQTRIITMSVTDNLATVQGSGYLNNLVDVNGNPVLSAVNGVYLNQYNTGGNGLVVNTGDFLMIAYAGGQNIFQVSIGGGNVVSLLNAASNGFVELYSQVTVTLAQFLAMYTTPIQLVAAAGANTIIVPRLVVIKMTYGSAQLAGGGAVSAQWGNTSHAGGVLATNTEAATDFTGATASTLFKLTAASGDSSQAAYSACVNAGIYLSCATAVFTAGTAATFKVGTFYNVITSNS